MYAWGRNDSGELGDGTTTNRPTPVQVGGVLAGKTITAITAGGFHTVALASDGAVYTWGWNPFGQLGDGTTTSRTNPVLVGGFTTQTGFPFTASITATTGTPSATTGPVTFTAR